MPTTDDFVPIQSVNSEESIQYFTLPLLDQFIGSSCSRKESHMPAKFTDYIVEVKHKYEIKRSVIYSFVVIDTRCFVLNLKETVKPKILMSFL